ncbi:MAG: acetate--CoA ligase, partial [Bacteroidota bacterium]
KLNITENCLDRHLNEKGDQPAIVWEPNDPFEKSRTLTYTELYNNVLALTAVLRKMGVKKGDRVCIYMGMVPELAVAMLACARIGAIHSIIFGGFSAQSIKDRVVDASANFIITCDGAFRGNKSIELKSVVDEAVAELDHVEKILVYQRTGCEIEMHGERDIWWHQAIAELKEEELIMQAEEMDAEDMLFILYTSGSTGKPKGVVHTTGGYMVWANYTFNNVFQYQDKQVHFCTADIGWITGHSYIVYGPLSAGATTLMFEGVPNFPDAGRFWEIIDKHQVNIFYTAPTAIRSLMTSNIDFVKKAKLDSLKVIGSVGEPINEEAWHWYNENIGKKNCPLVDTWWQTETGGIMISNLAGVTPQIPAHATLPLPGIQPCLMDENGNEIGETIASGNLCIKFPWPGMIRTTYGDHERCRLTYFATYNGYYFTGDGCVRDAEGNYRITGRVDDVLNVSGHRIGTAELENAINMHPRIAESAVVGIPHDIKGQGIYAFAVINGNYNDQSEIAMEIISLIQKRIGAIAKPDKVQLVKGLPKTRSGKIMRRILRKIAEGEREQIGDTSTLLDPQIVLDILAGRIA